MEKLPISVFIITQNEAQHLPMVLASCQRMDEIIVVDSGSQDNTVALAQQFGAKTYYQAWPGYAAQKNYALSLCRNEWVLNLDGDEVLNPQLVECFRRFIADNTKDALCCGRHEIFLNQRLSRFTHQLKKCRLFRKSVAQYDLSNLAHETLNINGTTAVTSLAFDHYGNNTVTIISAKNNLYAGKKAQEKLQKGKKISYLKLIFIFPLAFCKSYFLRRYIFSGVRGFILSVLDAYYAFLKEATLYEHDMLKKPAKP